MRQASSRAFKCMSWIIMTISQAALNSPYAFMLLFMFFSRNFAQMEKFF